MGRKIQTMVHHKIISEFRHLTGLTIAVDDCAYLARKYQSFGVEDYIIANYEGNSYFTRYIQYYVDLLPCWEYKKDYLIPLIFREMPDTHRMFQEPYRWEAFFKLLDWYLTYQPEKVLITCQKKPGQREIVDTAFLIFRLWEICDGAAFPIGNLNNLSEFQHWDHIFHLIDTGKSFRRTTDFNPEKIEDLTQLEVIIGIIKMRYQAILERQGYQLN